MSAKANIFVATPCYGSWLSEDYFHSILDLQNLCREENIALRIQTLGQESLVTRARNNLVAKGMANPTATHLMFIDADIGFETLDVYKLIASDKDVIGGLYPKKNYPVQYVINTIPGEEQQESGIQEVHDIGTGFLLIKRHVIEMMFQRYTDLKYKNSLNLDTKFEPFMYALFDTWLLPDGNYLSEDYTFCKRWKDMGGKIFAHNDVRLRHSGYHTFR